MKTKKQITQIDKNIANAVASVEMEGGKISDETKELVRKCALGEITLQECIDIIKSEYKDK
jgi:selenophosphate synthetase-related protein